MDSLMQWLERRIADPEMLGLTQDHFETGANQTFHLLGVENFVPALDGSNVLSAAT
jgi:hypothetical protein